MRLLLALVVWVAAVIGAVALSNTVASSISSSPNSTSVTAAAPQSLFQTSRFSRVLSALRDHLGADAQIDNFALYPGYAFVTAVQGGTELSARVDYSGNYQSYGTDSATGVQTLFSLARVKANVPSALVKRIATSAHVPESQLHYMVIQADPITGHVQWLVYPLEGSSIEYFQASGATGRLFELARNSPSGPQPIKG